MEKNNITDPHACVLQELHGTYQKKNADYGNSFSALYADLGMTYAYGHIAEKTARIRALMKCEAKVSGESLRDSLMDLANYAILTVMELDNRQPVRTTRVALHGSGDMVYDEILQNSSED